MPAGVLIPALIGAGGTVAQAAIGAHSAGKAADTQSAAADKALALEKSIYDTTQGQISPYQQLGTSSLANLAGYANGGGPQMNANGVGYHPGFTPQPMTLSGMQPTAPQAPTGPLVTVQAPTGETRQMTRAQAEPFLARGAKLVQQPGMAGGGSVGRTAMEY